MVRVAESKREAGLQVVDPAREERVLAAGWNAVRMAAQDLGVPPPSRKGAMTEPPKIENIWQDCLKSYEDPRGEWYVCSLCYEANLVKAVTEDQGAEVEQDFTEVVNKTLDYMVRFWEGGHTKSHMISDDTRNAILSAVKSTLEWK